MGLWCGVVCTPIFSRSELRPPSRSSIISIFLLTVEAFGAEELLLPAVHSSFSFCFPFHRLLEVKTQRNIFFFFWTFQHAVLYLRHLWTQSHKLPVLTNVAAKLVKFCPLLSNMCTFTIVSKVKVLFYLKYKFELHFAKILCYNIINVCIIWPV